MDSPTFVLLRFGWRFLLLPDWSALLRGEVLVAALGQAFFSIVAGLAIFPAVFAFGMDPQSGPQLAFITLPQIFLAMPGGTIAGIVFFGLLTSAAMTSMIALLEVPVATVVHRTRLRRWSAVTLVGTCVFVVGLPSALSYGLLAEVQIAGRAILDFVDQSVSNYLLPLVGFLVCIYVGWRWRREEALAASGIESDTLRAAWLWLLRVAAPAMILLVLRDSTGFI